MLFATKNNKTTRIADREKDSYVALGYTIKDSKGSVVAAPKSSKPATTKKSTSV